VKIHFGLYNLFNDYQLQNQKLYKTVFL